MTRVPNTPQSGTAAADKSGDKDVCSLVIILASVIVTGWFILQSVPLQSANDRSRWCTVWSLVERGTYQIDEIDQNTGWSTIDKVRFRHNEDEPWHFYSSKPPLFSTIVAGVYWCQKTLTNDDLSTSPRMVSRRILLVVNLLPWTLALLSFRGALLTLDVSGLPLWLLTGTAGFATMLNPYLTTLNNHTPAAICLTLCLSAMVRIAVATDPRRMDFVLVGFFAALTVCFELPAALFGLLSFAFVFSRDVRKTLVCYVPAAVIPLLAFFVTNYLVTGGVKPFYAYYGKEPYVYVHEGVPSYWSSPQGIDANTESPLTYLMHCTIGHHGILSLTPIFVTSLIGWLGFLRTDSSRRYPFIHWTGFALSVGVLCFYLNRPQNYNYGGNSAALRWMLWLAPFWWYGLIGPVQRLSKSKPGSALLGILLLASVYSSMEAMPRPWKPGWIYRKMESSGVIDYRTRVAPFEPKRYSILGSLAEQTSAVWRAENSQDSLRLSSDRYINVEGQQLLPMTIELQRSSGQTSTAQVVVFADRFRDGQRIERWLASRPKSWDLESEVSVTLELPTTAAPRWTTNTLRGIPTSRPYNAEGERYLKYSCDDGRRWAIRTIRGAARAEIPSSTEAPRWQRCDAYYSEDVPFGVAAWKITVTDLNSRKIATERWISEGLPPAP